MHISKIALATMLGVSFAFTSCSDDKADISGEKETLVYLYHLPNEYDTNTAGILMTSYPTWGINFDTPSETEFIVRTNHEAKQTVTASVSVNESAVTDGYELLPAASYSISETSVSIPAGQSAAPVTITLTDPAILTPDTDYMLPLELTSVQGAKLSSNLATATVLVRKSSKTVSTDRVGEEITDRTGWSCLYGQRDCPSIIEDPSAYTYWWQGTAIHPIEVSFGKTETGISGIKLNVYSTWYAASKITVYAAENPGEPYVEIASAEYPTASNQMILSWDKPEPVKAYWLRVDATPVSGNGLVPTYITVYKN